MEIIALHRWIIGLMTKKLGILPQLEEKKGAFEHFLKKVDAS
jgi:hypothetical protein